MDDEESCSVESSYEVLHKHYQRIKKLSKTENTENGEKSSAAVKKEMNDLIDLVIEQINAKISEEKVQSLRLLAMKMTMFYERSKLLISLGDEKLSQETLITALNMINDVVSKEEIIFLAFRIINHYAYLLSKQDDLETSRTVLEFGESIYNEAKRRGPTIKFFTSDDLFVPDNVAVSAPVTSNKLERLVTSNLQMLGFIYNKQELHDRFAEYHHEVLRRQLEMRDEDITMWAIKSARLASYFLSKNRFKEARHHLSAAIHVLREYEKELKSSGCTSSNANEKWQDFQQKFADVAKCWVKYGLFLFSVSKTNIVTQFCGEPNQILERLWTAPFETADGNVSKNLENKNFRGVASLQKEASSNANSEDKVFSRERESTGSRDAPGNLSKLVEEVQHGETMEPSRIDSEGCQGRFLIFESLNLADYENQVAASFVETTVQARALFLHTHAWLKRVKAHYTLNEHPMEYVNAILDLSELYRYLAFYEEDIESQYAVQKLRADALETLSTVLREIRPQCYMAVSIELLRELAEVQLEMMGLNLRRIYAAEESANETSEAMLHKMEALADVHSRLEQFGDNFGHNYDKGDASKIIENEETAEVGQFVI